MSEPRTSTRRHRCCHNHGESSAGAPAIVPRNSRTNKTTKTTKTKSSSRKRGASPESPSSQQGFLEQIITNEKVLDQLDLGAISLVDERGDAETLFVRRKSPRQDVKPPGLRSSTRPKTASPHRRKSSSHSPDFRNQSSTRPNLVPPSSTPVRTWSAPQPNKEADGRRSSLGDSIADERRESIPWSVTEVPDDGTIVDSLDTRDAMFMTPENLTISSQEDKKPERILKDPIRDMMTGSEEQDVDYDTDLEDDFPAKPKTPYDPAGRNVYVEKCREEGIDPASYVLRHLADQSFQLRHRYLNIQNVVPLTSAMKNNTLIETLDLSDNHLEAESGVAIASMLENNCSITKLDLSQNLINTTGVAAFSNMLETNYTLKTLCLRGNHLTDKDTITLAEALRNNSTLTELDLSHNQLGEMAGVHLGSGLAVNDGLIYLDLKWNAVRNKGITAIANALKVNSSLEVLDLSYNGVSVPGCIALMRALKVNAGLRILDLSHNHINSIGSQKLAIGVKKNSRLEAILLRANPIGDDGMVALLKAVLLNPTLKLLSVQDIPLPLIMHQKIRDVQETKDIWVLRLDVDGHKRNTPPSHIVAMVDKFISDNQSRILNRFFTQDVDHSGLLSINHIKKALWDAGLDVSEEQLETALKHTKLLGQQTVPYRPMLDGLSALLMTTSWKRPMTR